MRMRKTPKSQRETYQYVTATGEKIILQPGEDGVTEEWIHELHLADDREIENNLKHAKKPSTDKEKADEKEWKEKHPDEKYAGTWMLSLDASFSNDDGESTIDRDPAWEDKTASKFYAPYSNAAIDRLREIIRCLPSRQKQALNLVWFEGFSQVEAAKLMNCTKVNICKLNKAVCEKIRTDEELVRIFSRRG